MFLLAQEGALSQWSSALQPRCSNAGAGAVMTSKQAQEERTSSATGAAEEPGVSAAWVRGRGCALIRECALIHLPVHLRACLILTSCPPCAARSPFLFLELPAWEISQASPEARGSPVGGGLKPLQPVNDIPLWCVPRTPFSPDPSLLPSLGPPCAAIHVLPLRRL